MAEEVLVKCLLAKRSGNVKERINVINSELAGAPNFCESELI